MKIAFLIGCLAPGRDGVGDYTRLLAEECIRRGHQCTIISLNDRFVQCPVRDNGIATKPEILRLPALISWGERCSLAKKQIDAFRPDWISLQFVCYGFNEKGVIAFAGKHIVSLLAGYKTHIMFHELWVGAADEATLKERVTGAIQKPFIVGMAKAVKPEIVNTSNRVYASILDSNGIQAGILPLFGSIPVMSQNGDGWLFPKLNAIGLAADGVARRDLWFFGMFGALHSMWPPEPLMSYIKKAAIAHGKKICIISAGDLRGGESLWGSISDKYSPDIVFLKLGHLPEEKISEFFNSLDFGIATTPYALCEKSATVVSMLEHGLPVIVNRDDVSFRGIYLSVEGPDPLICRMGEDLPKRLFTMERRPPKRKLGRTAEQFLSELGKQQ